MDMLKSMRTLVEIADRGSLTAAAAALNESLPSVVRTLAQLERHLGVRLVARTTRRNTLTEEGRRYLERSRGVLAAAAEAEMEARSQVERPAGTVIVTAPVLFGQRHVAPALTRFCAEHAGLRARLLLLDRVVDLVEEGIDLGVRISALADSALVAQRVAHARRQVVASPEFLRRHRAVATPAELAGQPCVMVQTTQRGHWIFRIGAVQRSVELHGTLVFNLAESAIQACADGAGYGQFLSYQVEPWLRDGRLVRVLLDHEPDAVPISLVYPNRELLPAKTRALIAWLKADLSALAET